MGLYVCSDIHGMYDLYLGMLETVQFGDNDHLYILGDMIDRGPDGVKILLDVMQRDNVTCLIGNHEHMMWHYLNRHGDSIGDAWMLPGNGGSRTLTPYSMLLSEERRLIRSFLDKLYLQVELSVGGKRFLLSHSSFLPDHGTLRWQDPRIRDEESTRRCMEFALACRRVYRPFGIQEGRSPSHYRARPGPSDTSGGVAWRRKACSAAIF